MSALTASSARSARWRADCQRLATARHDPRARCQTDAADREKTSRRTVAVRRSSAAASAWRPLGHNLAPTVPDRSASDANVRCRSPRGARRAPKLHCSARVAAGSRRVAQRRLPPPCVSPRAGHTRHRHRACLARNSVPSCRCVSQLILVYPAVSRCIPPAAVGAEGSWQSVQDGSRIETLTQAGYAWRTPEPAVARARTCPLQTVWAKTARPWRSGGTARAPPISRVSKRTPISLGVHGFHGRGDKRGARQRHEITETVSRCCKQ